MADGLPRTTAERRVDGLIADFAVAPGAPPAADWRAQIDRHATAVPDEYRLWLQRIGVGTFGPARLELFADPQPLAGGWRVSNPGDFWRIGRDDSGLTYCFQVTTRPWELVALTEDSIMPIMGLDFATVMRESLSQAPTQDQRHDDEWERGFQVFLGYAMIAVLVLAVVAFVVFFALADQHE